MRSKQRLRCLQLVIFVVLASSRPLLADYIGSNGYAPVRIRDNGTLAPPTYDVSSFSCHLSCFVESPAPQVTLSPDSTIVYGLGTSLGLAFDTIPWNTNTGQVGAADGLYLMNQNDFLDTGFISDGPQPIVRNNELFAIGPVYSNGQYSNTSWQVKRYSFATDSLIENINPPTPQVLHDIAFDQLGNLYVAGASGIYRYTHRFFPGVFDTYIANPTNPVVPGVDGNIAIGIDNLLYVRNSATGDVQRYASGIPLGTFISHTAYPNLGTIQFGPDGNLHAFQGGASPNLLTFSGLNGTLLFSTPATQITNGRIFYLVPEPTAAVVLYFAGFTCLLRRRTRVTMPRSYRA